MTEWGRMLDSHIDKGAGMTWEDRAYLDGWTRGAIDMHRLAENGLSRKSDYLVGYLKGCGTGSIAPFPRGMRDAALSAFGLV